MQTNSISQHEMKELLKTKTSCPEVWRLISDLPVSKVQNILQTIKFILK